MLICLRRTFAWREISIGIEGFSQQWALAVILTLFTVRACYQDLRTLLRGLAHSYGAAHTQVRPDKVTPIMRTHQVDGTRACPH